jgi:poly-gamma-glutamate synthesis protein (capsule biosynthesis protein)
MAKRKKFLIFGGVFLSLAALVFWRVFLNRPKKITRPLISSRILTPTPSPELSRISLTVAGDVMLARSVTVKMRALENFSYPFAEIAPVLRRADLTLINLESPFGENCLSTDTGMRFCADSRAVEGLIDSGVDLVSLANNHALDQREDGLTETIELISQNFMTPIGLKEPVFLKIRGINLVFLAYNAVLPKSELIAWAYPEVVESEIKRFSQESDLLIVYFHWGQEYLETPQAGSGCPYDPRKLAHLAIDSGADLVLGSHPHVVQENEWYQGKLIVYSLGNFVFDQSWSQSTQKGLIAEFVLTKNGLVDSKFSPVTIVGFQPRLDN